MNWTEVQAMAAEEGWSCEPHEIVERLDLCAKQEADQAPSVGTCERPEDCTFYHAARLIEHLLKTQNSGRTEP